MHRSVRAIGIAVVISAWLVCGLNCKPSGPPEASCKVAIEGPQGEVGFGVETRLQATEVCGGRPTGGLIHWSTGATGPELKLKTPTAEERLVVNSRAGVLPVSADQAVLRITASTAQAASDFGIMLAHRHSGLTSVPLGVGIYVYGGPGGSVQRFEAAKSGRHPIRDAATGFETRLMAGRPDQVPMDCARSDCHSDLAAAHATTRHGSALSRALHTPPRGHDPKCLKCHAVAAEKGIPGGFLDVAEQLGFGSFPQRSMTFDELPSPMRRLGNVGCLACHGPGRIPEPAERAIEYSAGVCAQCHDAPPRYATVRDWRSSRMSQLPADALKTGCANCHTAQGFVARLKGRTAEISGHRRAGHLRRVPRSSWSRIAEHAFRSG